MQQLDNETMTFKTRCGFKEINYSHAWLCLIT